MTRHALRHGLYHTPSGAFWFRPTINGRRTWKRLASLSEGDARQEIATLSSDHARSRLGLCADPLAPPSLTWGQLADRYVTAPDAPASYRHTIPRLRAHFGSTHALDISIPMILKYGAKRPTRAADLDLAILSSVMTWGVMRGLLRHNPIKIRPRLHHIKRHSNEVMPADAEELHALAAKLLPVAVGWQLLFAALTGCRTSEILRWRMDASGRKDPGWVEGRYLYVRRSKKGVNPFVELTPELSECIAAHHKWHNGESPWWFPGADIYRPLNRVALTHALARLGGPKRTAHGLRAYCATVWRSRGESNEQVAARLGDKTAALIESSYGALPESWSGGEPLGWRPKVGKPSWDRI